MSRWLNRGELTYEVTSAPAGDGFIAVISQIRVEQGKITQREEWHRLDFPRPTQRLAENDDEALAITLLDQADAGATAATGAPIDPPHVAADEVMARPIGAEWRHWRWAVRGSWATGSGLLLRL